MWHSNPQFILICIDILLRSLVGYGSSLKLYQFLNSEFILFKFMKFDKTVNSFFKFHESQQNKHSDFKTDTPLQTNLMMGNTRRRSKKQENW